MESSHCWALSVMTLNYACGASPHCSASEVCGPWVQPSRNAARTSALRILLMLGVDVALCVFNSLAAPRSALLACRTLCDDVSCGSGLLPPPRVRRCVASYRLCVSTLCVLPRSSQLFIRLPHSSARMFNFGSSVAMRRRQPDLIAIALWRNPAPKPARLASLSFESGLYFLVIVRSLRGRLLAGASPPASLHRRAVSHCVAPKDLVAATIFNSSDPWAVIVSNLTLPACLSPAAVPPNKDQVSKRK